MICNAKPAAQLGSRLMLILLLLVFLLCGHTPADMPLGFVLVKNPSHHSVKMLIALGQPLGQVLMYS